MKLNIVYAVGNKNRITGNEPVFQTVLTYEEYKEFCDRHNIIVINIWKYEDAK